MPGPIENPPTETLCEACEICQSAGDNQLLYCHQGEMRTLAAPTDASYLAFDPVTGFQWIPVLGPQMKRPDPKAVN